MKDIDDRRIHLFRQRLFQLNAGQLCILNVGFLNVYVSCGRNPILMGEHSLTDFRRLTNGEVKWDIYEEPGFIIRTFLLSSSYVEAKTAN